MALHVTGVYKGEERQKVQKKIFEEIMGEAFKFDENDTFKNLRNSQTSSKRNLKKTNPRHIIIKLLKTINKDKVLKLPEEIDMLYTKEQK